MSSTDEPALSGRLRRFFDGALMPASDAVRKRKGALFESGFDPGLSSYYVERSNRTMTREQFEIAGLENPEQLGRALGEFWKERRMPELLALAAGLSELAGDLREVEEEADEVSPFIYVMF